MKKEDSSERQIVQLTELNHLKNNLVSVVAHDQKGLLYALLSLFKNVESHDFPAGEIKALIPEVIRDLQAAIQQMESILLWVKSQMQQEVVEPQVLDIANVILEVLLLLHLQLEGKRIRIDNRIRRPVAIRCDKEMVRLVLRNLLSNAIKFTGEGGTITLDITEGQSSVEVFIRDTRVGIPARSPDLGLILSEELLSRNRGRLYIHSQQGDGSVFSFTLPKIR